MSRGVRARRAGGVALSFPPGLVQLTAGAAARPAHWESELAAACPRLSRLDRELVLSMLVTTGVTDVLGQLPTTQDVLLGVVQQGDDLAGVVVLAVGALETGASWRAADLPEDLTNAFEGNYGVEVHPLRCRNGTAVLVRHPGDVEYLGPPAVDELVTVPVQRTDLYLAEGLSGTVAVVSCTSVGAPEAAVTELLQQITASLRAA